MVTITLALGQSIGAVDSTTCAVVVLRTTPLIEHGVELQCCMTFSELNIFVSKTKSTSELIIQG